MFFQIFDTFGLFYIEFGHWCDCNHPCPSNVSRVRV